MHNPLRSEADAFRWVVIFGTGAASVIVLVLLTSPSIGIVWAAALLGFGAGMAYRSSRGSMPRSVSLRSDGDATYRLLVVANQTVEGRALLEEISSRCAGRESEILLTTPALVGSRAAHWASDIDEGIALAQRRMELSLIAIKAAGLEAWGEVGDADPNLAIADALRDFAADEILISTLPAEKSRWLEHDVVRRAREEVDLPVAHVVVDIEAEAANGAAPASLPAS
jgi:hypothetical protein